MEKYIRKVTRVGKRSLSVVIPAEIVDELKIRESPSLKLRRTGESRKLSLDEAARKLL